jgi:acyl-CoA synthetase (AMP-forming)/AMP-acid ligase II/thioesterase domain-containing protein
MAPALQSGNSLPELVRRRAEIAPGSPALLSAAGPISYEALVGHCATLDARLLEAGVRPGQRVAVVLPNGTSLAVAYLAVSGRAAFAPLNPSYTRAELDFYLEDLAATTLVTGLGVDAAALELARERGLGVIEIEQAGTGTASGPWEPVAGADDVALVLHTSGTTARPKIVPLTHRNLCASASNVARTLALTEDDRSFNVMPLFHIHGLVGVVLSSLWAGGNVVCTPGFHAPSFLDSLAEWSPTWYSAVPTMHQAVLARAGEGVGKPKHSLRFIRSSSAALPVPVLEALESTFDVPVIEAYGMTEAAHQMASNRLQPGGRRAGSVGQAAGPEIAVLGPAGEELGRDEVGEVAIRGENVFAGYEANAEATAAAFAGDWFRTGDQGRLDADGFLFLEGRLKEIINRGGEKVSPGEVEAVLLSHPSVDQATVFAVPDELLGEDVGAALVIHPGAAASETELQAFVARELADFKVPRVLAFVDEIPKGATGKVQRIGLAEKLGVTATRAREPVAFAPPRSAVERQLVEMVEDVLGVEHIGVYDDFFALGGDSLLAAELVARIREAHGRPHFPLSTLVWAPTVEKLARELEAPTAIDRPLIVPLQPDGDGVPLVFIHALDGEIVRYAGLARRLARDRPFLAIRARGADGDEPPHMSLRAMVDDYAAAVRDARPEGSVILGGVCLGGALAIEVANRLEQSGGEVSLLVLIDPRLHVSPSARWIRTQASLAVRKVLTGDYSWKLIHADRRREVRDALLRELGRSPAETDPGRRRFDEAMASIRTECTAKAYDAPVAIFSTIDYPLREWFWQPLLKGLIGLRELPHRHGSILRPPAVDELAQAIQTTIDERGLR